TDGLKLAARVPAEPRVVPQPRLAISEGPSGRGTGAAGILPLRFGRQAGTEALAELLRLVPVHIGRRQDVLALMLRVQLPGLPVGDFVLLNPEFTELDFMD